MDQQPDMVDQELVQYPTPHMDDQHELMRAAVVSSLGQAAASQSQHDPRVDIENVGQRDGGDESMEIGELPLDMGFASGGGGEEEDGEGGEDEEEGGGGGGVGDITGDDNLGEDGLPISPSSNNKRRSSMNGTSSGGTPKRSKANAAGPGTPMTEEEKKVKLREANRKAAERSRGKKRGELHALEETVRNIQEENGRLRTQLESLLAIATTSSASTNINTNTTANHNNNNNTNGEAGPSQSIDPTLSSSSDDVIVPGDVETPYNGMPITGLLGELGLDIPLLSSLHRQIITLRAQVVERERSLDSSIQSGSTTATTTTTTATTNNKQIRSERTALISLIAHLKEEREKIDRENALLEREIKQKRVVNGVIEGGVSQEEEKKDGDDSVAVERALIEIRSWLDEALKGWQDTGVLKRPPTTTLPTRDSVQQQQQQQQQPIIQSSHPNEEYHPDFSFQAEDLTPEQVNQYAQAYATSMGGGTGQENGQGHMNLLSEVSMTQGR